MLHAGPFSSRRTGGDEDQPSVALPEARLATPPHELVAREGEELRPAINSGGLPPYGEQVLKRGLDAHALSSIQLSPVD